MLLNETENTRQLANVLGWDHETAESEYWVSLIGRVESAHVCAVMPKLIEIPDVHVTSRYEHESPRNRGLRKWSTEMRPQVNIPEPYRNQQ